MLQKITAWTVALLASVLLAGPALAGSSKSCAEIGPFVRGDDAATKGWAKPYSITTEQDVEFAVVMNPGDKLSIRVTPESGAVEAMSNIEGSNVFNPGPFLADIITSEVTLTSSLSMIFVGLSPSGETAEGVVTVYCAGTSDPDSGDGEEGGESVLTGMQDGVVQQSSSIATEMITDLVGNADAANSFMGYAGTMLVSEPVDGSGSTIWAGLKYHWTFGDENQWTGGQWTGTGGINFRLDDAWVIGVFGAYEQSGMTLAAQDQSFDGSGASLGVTAAYRFDDWRVELLGYGSRLAYDLDADGTTGSFGAWRYVLDGKLIGTLPVTANLDFSPVAGLAVVREFHEAYTDSDAASHDARDYLAARVSAGGKLILYPLSGGFTLAAGSYADYWTTENLANSGLTGRVELDASIDLNDVAKLRLNAGVDSIGGTQLGATVGASLKGGF